MMRIALLIVAALVMVAGLSGPGQAEDNQPLTYPGIGEQLGGEGSVGGNSPTEPPDEVNPQEEDESDGGGPSTPVPATEPVSAPPEPVNPDPPPKGPEPTKPSSSTPTSEPSVSTPSVTLQPVVQALPSEPPDICVNRPGMKNLPDEWTRTPEGVCNPPLPRAGYCHLVNGSWTFRELVVGQHENDPHWAAQGPWREARKDPQTGAIDCEFHKSQTIIPESSPQAPTAQLSAQPQPTPPPPKASAPVAAKPISPPPRASPGPVTNPPPAQPARKSRSIAPPPPAPPAP